MKFSNHKLEAEESAFEERRNAKVTEGKQDSGLEVGLTGARSLPLFKCAWSDEFH